MSSRVSLVDRYQKDKTEIDPELEASFVKTGSLEPEVKAEVIVPPASAPLNQTAAMSPGLISVNVRIRPDLAQALKTASLDRQMKGVEPFSRREIIEVALEPWLKSEGYLSD